MKRDVRYEFIRCDKCGRKFQLIDFHGNPHQWFCGGEPDHQDVGALMARTSIDYMNARKELRKGSDHSKKRAVKYAPEREADATEIARNIIGEFSLWAELSRQQLVARLAIPQADETETIPF